MNPPGALAATGALVLILTALPWSLFDSRSYRDPWRKRWQYVAGSMTVLAFALAIAALWWQVAAYEVAR